MFIACLKWYYDVLQQAWNVTCGTYIYIYTSSLNFFSRSGISVTNGNHYILFENHAICYHIPIEVDTFHHVSIAIRVGQMPNEHQEQFS